MVFEEVIRHTPASSPASYRRVPVEIKETRDSAWICLPDDPYLPDELVSLEDAADDVLASAIAVTGQQIAKAVHKTRRPRREDDSAIAR